jgi:hypothetical protein
MSVLDEISAELARQREDGFDEDDALRSWSDWAAIAIGYVGRGVPIMYRNEREGLKPREMFIKAAAVLVAAIEAKDGSWAAHEAARK